VGYLKTDISFERLAETFTHRDFGQFIIRFPVMGWITPFQEQPADCRSLQLLVHEIQIDDLDHAEVGVFAQAISAYGELLQDSRAVQ
jgi:hypothetical protein